MLDYRELISSQLPALHLLTGIGWEYLTPDQANPLRGNRRSAVILEGVLTEWLRTHNVIAHKDSELAFSDANIAEAVRRLKALDPTRGLIPASIDTYELLTLGTSLDQAIDGDRRGYSLHYIDWKHPENNVYHVTDEFSVERSGNSSIK